MTRQAAPKGVTKGAPPPASGLAPGWTPMAPAPLSRIYSLLSSHTSSERLVVIKCSAPQSRRMKSTCLPRAWPHRLGDLLPYSRLQVLK